MMNHPILNIVIALHCEAKPLIEHFQLKKISTEKLPFPIFTNKDKRLNLIISGIGKVKSAIATTFLSQWTGSQSHACFLNIGIAGASQFEINKAILINKLTEATTQRNWYPFTSHLKFNHKSCLITHDSPQTTYPEVGVVDMEGTAFYQAATCFVSQEQVQIIKVISDNNLETMHNINEDNVKQLIQHNINQISNLILQLLNLSKTEVNISKEPNALSEFLSKWHFTHTQTLQLREYLRRWDLHMQKDSFLHCQNEKTANQVIKKILATLDNHANSLY